MTTIDSQLDLLRSHPRYASATMEPWHRRGTHGGFLVTIPGLVLPEGWNRRSATVAFWVPAHYLVPDRGFWTLPDLWLDTGMRLADGRHPRWVNTYPDHQPPGHTDAMWWCWGPCCWNANGDDLLTLARLIHSRFDLRNEQYEGGD